MGLQTLLLTVSAEGSPSGLGMGKVEASKLFSSQSRHGEGGGPHLDLLLERVHVTAAAALLLDVLLEVLQLGAGGQLGEAVLGDDDGAVQQVGDAGEVSLLQGGGEKGKGRLGPAQYGSGRVELGCRRGGEDPVSRDPLSIDHRVSVKVGRQLPSAYAALAVLRGKDAP